MRHFVSLLTLFVMLVFISCKKDKASAQSQKGIPMTIQLTSTEFKQGGMIPRKFTCDGENISPELSWNNIPDSTKSLAIITEDPDAPMKTWIHWVIFNIPPSIHKLPEHVPTLKKLESGALQGTNDFRNIGFGGPCPPSGTHRYFFKIYALDSMLSLKAGSTKPELEKAMKSHILAEGELMGRYTR